LELLKGAKKWKPGLVNGKPVRVAYTLPIRLNLKK
jgi:protein TonB